MMIKALALAGALCAAACESAAASTLYPHVPLLLWSQRPVFNAKETYLSTVADESKVASALQDVIAGAMSKDASLSVLDAKSVNGPSAEALCVFLHASLRTEQLGDFGKASYVQKAIKESPSSVVVPHTTRTYSLHKALAGAKPAVVSVEDVEAWIKTPEGQALLTNGRSDLLVVEVPKHYPLSEADALIQNAASALAAFTRDRVDFALTGDEAEPVSVQDPFARRRLATTTTKPPANASMLCETDYRLGFANGKSFCFPHYVRMTPHVLTGLLFGFFFIFLAYVGLSVLHAIQTPTRYPHHGPPKGKEF